MLPSFFDIERLAHSFKTLIAVVIGFLFAQILGYPADQWIIITIIVVMCAQLYVGSVVQRAYLRFLGTFIGCLFATITLLTLGDTNIAIACAIGFSSFFFSYVATSQENLGYASTLGAVTTVIIMIGPHPTILLAGQRFLEISIGIFIATMVSQFVLPIHARAHLRRNQAATLEQLKNFYSATMIKPDPSVNPQDLDENIIKSLLRQRQLAKESVREPFGLAFDPKHFINSLYCEREILRCITFMHKAILNLKHAEPKLAQLPTLHLFNEEIIQVFTILIKTISDGKPLNEHIHLPSLAAVKENLQKNAGIISQEESIYIDGFLFSAEILVKSLANLAMLSGALIYT